jgi:hypothetical protein
MARSAPQTEYNQGYPSGGTRHLLTDSQEISVPTRPLGSFRNSWSPNGAFVHNVPTNCSIKLWNYVRIRISLLRERKRLNRSDRQHLRDSRCAMARIAGLLRLAKPFWGPENGEKQITQSRFEFSAPLFGIRPPGRNVNRRSILPWAARGPGHLRISLLIFWI